MMSCDRGRGIFQRHLHRVRREPGIARGAILKTAPPSKALADAMRVSPALLNVQPCTQHHSAAVHLCMKDGDLKAFLSGRPDRSPSGSGRTAAGLQRAFIAGKFLLRVPGGTAPANWACATSLCALFAFWRTDMRPTVSMQKVRK